jgi:hypothetical protein
MVGADLRRRAHAASSVNIVTPVPAAMRTAASAGDVSQGRGEIMLRAERKKDRETRIIPISSRLRAIIEMRRTDPGGRPFPPSGHVFGDEVGRAVGSVRRAWQTTVLKPHGTRPSASRRRRKGPTGRATQTRAQGRAAHRRSTCTFTISVTRAIRVAWKDIAGVSPPRARAEERRRPTDPARPGRDPRALHKSGWVSGRTMSRNVLSHETNDSILSWRSSFSGRTRREIVKCSGSLRELISRSTTFG